MTILFYYSKHTRAKQQAAEVMASINTDNVMEAVNTLPALSSRIRRQRFSISVMLVFVSDDDELDALCLMKEILQDIPMILVLHDLEQDSLIRGHRLAPRYLTCSSPGLSDVKQVLKKMIERKVHP